MGSKHKSVSNSFDIKLEKVTTLFRFIEMFLFLIMASRCSSQLPFVVKVSGDYFKGVTFTMLNSKFVFVIGNMIILILYFTTRAVESNDGEGNDDLCYEYVKKFDMNVVSCANVSHKRKISRSKSDNKMRVKCEDDHTRQELRKCETHISSDHTEVSCANVSPKMKTSRSQSDNRMRINCNKNQIQRELRRCVTEISADTAVIEKTSMKEELSSDDFRRTVEDFIARQQKILRDEEFSPIVYIGSQ